MTNPLAPMLAEYVRRVAAELGVPPESVGHEVSDTATAYIGLPHPWPAQPGRDLMLGWDERLGWFVAVEAVTAGENQHVVAYFDDGVVPPPAAVAVFVADVVNGRVTDRVRPVVPPTDRDTLADRMSGARA
jgi:hypothetical protein